MSSQRRVVVVTGGTKGIGRALVEAFLQRGCAVGLCARSAAAVDETVRTLGARYGADRVAGLRCDVSVYEDNVALWEHVERSLGAPDLWIANAGTSNVQTSFVSLDPQSIDSVVRCNLVGTMNSARAALERMQKLGRGGFYTMEGFGSDGRSQRGMSVYGSTKAAIRYFTRALVDELAGGPVIVGSLGPGVVFTDLLVGVYEAGDPALWERARWWFRFIADPADTVAAWLADRVLENTRSGEHFPWMTLPKALSRFVQPSYYRRDLLGDAKAAKRTE